MLKLIVFLVGAVAAISGEVIDNNDEGHQEKSNGGKVVEKRSIFPSSGGFQQQSGLGLVNIPPFNIDNTLSSNAGTSRHYFNNLFDSFGIPPYNSVNSFYPNDIHTPFNSHFYNGVIPPYFNGIHNPFTYPPYNTGIDQQSFNPLYFPFYNNYLPHFGGMAPVAGTAYCTCPPGLLHNHGDAFHEHQDAAHINHEPAIVSTVSETISESLPHGEKVVTETKEFTSHIGHGSHGPRGYGYLQG